MEKDAKILHFFLVHIVLNSYHFGSDLGTLKTWRESFYLSNNVWIISVSTNHNMWLFVIFVEKDN